jgi:hypothetical protein
MESIKVIDDFSEIDKINFCPLQIEMQLLFFLDYEI